MLSIKWMDESGLSVVTSAPGVSELELSFEILPSSNGTLYMCNVSDPGGFMESDVTIIRVGDIMIIIFPEVISIVPK